MCPLTGRGLKRSQLFGQIFRNLPRQPGVLRKRRIAAGPVTGHASLVGKNGTLIDPPFES